MESRVREGMDREGGQVMRIRMMLKDGTVMTLTNVIKIDLEEGD